MYATFQLELPVYQWSMYWKSLWRTVYELLKTRMVVGPVQVLTKHHDKYVTQITKIFGGHFKRESFWVCAGWHSGAQRAL